MSLLGEPLPSGDFFQHIGSAAGKELKKEMNNCNVLYDLPPENALRKELSKMKAKLEEFVDKLLALEL